jgi:hypothetical protein
MRELRRLLQKYPSEESARRSKISVSHLRYLVRTRGIVYPQHPKPREDIASGQELVSLRDKFLQTLEEFHIGLREFARKYGISRA